MPEVAQMIRLYFKQPLITDAKWIAETNANLLYFIDTMPSYALLTKSMSFRH